MPEPGMPSQASCSSSQMSCCSSKRMSSVPHGFAAVQDRALSRSCACADEGVLSEPSPSMEKVC
jgi:hypothetical protein